MGEPFENSEAWKPVRALANRAYALCRRASLSKGFGLCDPLARAAVSVMNNVAEGWESLHAAQKRQACNHARRSCGEVHSMTYVLLDNPFISAGDQQELLAQCIQAWKLITGLIRALGDRT